MNDESVWPYFVSCVPDFSRLFGGGFRFRRFGPRGALDRSRKIRDLESEVESLRWENIRLALKIETIDGASLVMDRVTGLWHNDVSREPFTGMILEKYPDQSPRAEAGF